MKIKKNEILKCIKIFMLSIFAAVLVWTTLFESSDENKAEAKEKSTHSQSQSTNLHEANSKDIRIWTDPDTGVQYIIYSRKDGYGGMGGITPRINLDGTLYQP